MTLNTCSSTKRTTAMRKPTLGHPRGTTCISVRPCATLSTKEQVGTTTLLNVLRAWAWTIKTSKGLPSKSTSPTRSTRLTSCSVEATTVGEAVRIKMTMRKVKRARQPWTCRRRFCSNCSRPTTWLKRPRLMSRRSLKLPSRSTTSRISI